jgi:hypothetical protein
MAMEGIEDTIRKYEFILNAEAELEGKSTEYREGFIAGCRFLVEFETERLKKEANRENKDHA